MGEWGGGGGFIPPFKAVADAAYWDPVRKLTPASSLDVIRFFLSALQASWGGGILLISLIYNLIAVLPLIFLTPLSQMY